MMDHVDDYIMVQNLIPIQLCKVLIRGCEKLKWSKHTWYNYNEDKSTSMPQKELDVVYSTEEQFKQLGQYLGRALQNYQKKYSAKGDKTENLWVQHISQVRFNRYKAGTKMRLHYDHIHSLFDGKHKGIPVISIVGLLNDNYQGAEFICRDKEIKLKRGDILLFPSNFMYPHKVKETTKGVRYSFSCWGF